MRRYEPDARPSRVEVLCACIFAVLGCLIWWLVTIMATPLTNLN